MGRFMILRRIREHVTHHNWFAVAVDFVIVVLGVFVGIQASNWNQARLDRAQGREYRAMLVDDLHTNQHNLAMRKRYYEWVRSEALKTQAALDGPESALGAQFLVDAYQATQILPWSLTRNTYDQIIAAGRISELGNADLRDKVSNYYVGSEVTGDNLASVMPYRDILRRAMPYAAQYQIRTVCGERITENSRGEAIMVLPEHCSIRLDPPTLRQAIRQVRDTAGLSLDLNRQLVDLDQKLVSVDVIMRRAGELERALSHSQ
jgi:hypothetical protein